jgi:predicted GIY-YIG superfamily endonuclease
MARVPLRGINHRTVVYCLSAGTHTYVGMTNNMRRRLRQHNGEIVNGARTTHLRRPVGESWRLHFLVSGFSRRSTAAQLERRLHGRVTLPRRKSNPFGNTSKARRAWQLYWAFQLERFFKKAPRIDDMEPVSIYWAHKEDAAVASSMSWPACIARHVPMTRDHGPGPTQ